MTPNQMEQDFHFLRSQVQRLSRLIDALESSPLLTAAMTPPEPEFDLPEIEANIRPLADAEREAITKAYEIYGSNYTAASKLLGIGKTTYHRKLREYGMRG